MTKTQSDVDASGSRFTCTVEIQMLSITTCIIKGVMTSTVIGVKQD